jgi:hypothetical protein
VSFRLPSAQAQSCQIVLLPPSHPQQELRRRAALPAAPLMRPCIQPQGGSLIVDKTGDSGYLLLNRVERGACVEHPRHLAMCLLEAHSLPPFRLEPCAEAEAVSDDRRTRLVRRRILREKLTPVAARCVRISIAAPSRSPRSDRPDSRGARRAGRGRGRGAAVGAAAALVGSRARPCRGNGAPRPRPEAPRWGPSGARGG